MAEEQLDRLLERIRREGVEKAEQQAQALLDDARSKAKTIVEEASKSAEALIGKARAEAESLRLRTEAALRQAARDVQLGVEKAVSKSLDGLVRLKVEAALTKDGGNWLPELIRLVVMSYTSEAKSAAGVAVAVSAKQHKAFAASLKGMLKEAVERGLTIEPDEALATGFKIKLKDRHVEHDFSGAAISDAIARLVHADVAQWLKAAPTQERQ